MAIKKLDGNFNVDSWRQMLSKGEKLRLTMSTEDMCPHIRPGDILEFKEAKLMDLAKRDLVLMFSKGSLRLRRIKSRLINESGEQFILAADGLKDSESRHGFEDILGKVVSITRDGEILRTRGDSVFYARIRRKFKAWIMYLWHSYLLSKSNDSD